MKTIYAKLMSLSAYQNMLETEPVKCLIQMTAAKTAEAMIRAYTSLIHSVWKEGFVTLSESLCWHLKYDDSFVGRAIAAGEISENMRDAAAMDIRRLSSLGMMNFSGLKRNIHSLCAQQNPDLGAIAQNLAELPAGRGFMEEEIFDSYTHFGCGQFAQNRAYRWENGEILPLKKLHVVRQENLIGYGPQRQAVLENTQKLAEGDAAENVLLYGDSGTGKSAAVKSLLQIPAFYRIRIVELPKQYLGDLDRLLRLLGEQTQRFIVFVDGLDLAGEDISRLSEAMQTGLERRPENVAIYVTGSKFAQETPEGSRLADAFGLRLAYLALDEKRYTEMVLELCHRRGVKLADGDIEAEAERWMLQQGERTPRTACQLVQRLASFAL